MNTLAKLCQYEFIINGYFGGYRGDLFSGSGSLDFYDSDYGRYDYDSVYGAPPSFEDSLSFHYSYLDYYIDDGNNENFDESMAYLDGYSNSENDNDKSFSPGKLLSLIIIFVIIVFVQCSV